MSPLTVELKGLRLLLILPLVLAYFGYRYSIMQRTLQSDVRERITHIVQARCARQLLPGVQQALADSDQAAFDTRTQNLLETMEQVEIVELATRGRGENIYVRARVAVDGEPPPDGKDVCYYWFRFSLVAGWTVEEELFWWQYYLWL